MTELVIREPDLQDSKATAEQILDTAEMLVVRTQEEFEGCAKFLQKVKGALAELEQRRRSIVDPINLAVKRINDLFRGPRETLEVAETSAKGAMARYSQEQERKAREEEARLRRLAAEENAKKIKAAEREAEKAEKKGDPALAESIRDQAQATLIPPPILQAETPKAAGISMRTVWKFRIVNEALVPREYLVPDERKIGGVVRSLQDKASIPGVEVYAEQLVASTSER